MERASQCISRNLPQPRTRTVPATREAGTNRIHSEIDRRAGLKPSVTLDKSLKLTETQVVQVGQTADRPHEFGGGGKPPWSGEGRDMYPLSVRCPDGHCKELGCEVKMGPTFIVEVRIGTSGSEKVPEGSDLLICVLGS